jgi:hypothetical protein
LLTEGKLLGSFDEADLNFEYVDDDDDDRGVWALKGLILFPSPPSFAPLVQKTMTQRSTFDQSNQPKEASKFQPIASPLSLPTPNP